jgi:hypothetical protein
MICTPFHLDNRVIRKKEEPNFQTPHIVHPISIYLCPLSIRMDKNDFQKGLVTQHLAEDKQGLSY